METQKENKNRKKEQKRRIEYNMTHTELVVMLGAIFLREIPARLYNLIMVAVEFIVKKGKEKAYYKYYIVSLFCFAYSNYSFWFTEKDGSAIAFGAAAFILFLKGDDVKTKMKKSKKEKQSQD